MTQKLLLGTSNLGKINEFKKILQNIPYELIRPLIHNVTVQGTALSAELRTTTATSFSGTEIPWIDNGFEPISLNQTNYLTTPRTIASKVNAAEQLLSLIHI